MTTSWKVRVARSLCAAAVVLALTGCPPGDETPDAPSGMVIDTCSSGLTPGAACSFTMACNEYIDFVDGGCGRIETSCVGGVVVVDDMTFPCSLPDASVDAPPPAEDASVDAPPPAEDVSVDAPSGDDASCDEGLVTCGSPASVCCGGTVRTFFDGPCMPRPDAGMPTPPDCAADAFQPGCPCATEGAQGCPGGSLGTLLTRWSTTCRGGVYVEQYRRICCAP